MAYAELYFTDAEDRPARVCDGGVFAAVYDEKKSKQKKAKKYKGGKK